MPEQKSLFGKDNQRGLPIGNLTSQFWANVYFNELDQFVKRTLKCRYYVRYVDDLILLDTSPESLRQWREAIAAFLGERLQLRLREPPPNQSRSRMASTSSAGPPSGAIGTRVGGHWRVVRRGCSDLRCRELQPLRGAAATPAGPERQPEALPALRATLASYSGHLRHGGPAGSGGRCGSGTAGCRRFSRSDAARPVACASPLAGASSLGGQRFSYQYGRFIRPADHDTLVFLQVGKFVEFYGPQRILASRAFRLVRVAIARGGFGFCVGFPLRLRQTYIARAVRAGYAVAEVREVERLSRTCVMRQIVAVWIPAAWRG